MQPAVAATTVARQMSVWEYVKAIYYSDRPATLALLHTPSKIWLRALSADSQNLRHSAKATYSPLHRWESGDGMAPLIHHCPSKY
eukprot:3990839-Pleurochrysis_carterae.AAC.1